MTITLMDLYNTAAAQEWSMYDSDVTTAAEFERPLVIAINKAITDIFSSYDFPFRERTHIILTIPKVANYDLPNGIIKKDGNNKYSVSYNSDRLSYVETPSDLSPACGIPNSFFIKGNQIVLFPKPVEKGILLIEYNTLSIGEDSNGNEIYELKNANDIMNVPPYLEPLVKEAVITRTMLNTIASESDENFSAYKKQADNALKLLIKYSKGVEPEKRVAF